MYGIEKSNYKNVVTTATCSTSYGIKINQTMRVYKYDKTDVIRNPVTNDVIAQHQMIWLIRRGDLLLSDVHKETEQQVLWLNIRRPELGGLVPAKKHNAPRFLRVPFEHSADRSTFARLTDGPALRSIQCALL